MQDGYDMTNKVLIHGVIQKSGCDVPSLVFQDELTGKRADASQGTVKAAVLKHDSQSSNLIIVSCYN